MDNFDITLPFSMYREVGEGRLINTHSHSDAMELVQVTNGRIRAQIGTEYIEAGKGDFLYIPPTMIFRAESIEGTGAVRGLIFNSSILEENMQSFDTELLYMFYIQSRNKLAVFGEGHPVHFILSRFMQEAYDEYTAKDVCYKLPIRASIYLMMTALLRFYCGNKDELDEHVVYHNVLRLRPVVEYISAHFCEKIYIESLSDMLSVSPDYFTKMFKDSIGRTPIDYINGMRINEAMNLLCNTEDSMAEIADKIGFCNPNYFHKIFKQYMGISPLAYRKSIK